MVRFYNVIELESQIKEISHQNIIKNDELIVPLLAIEIDITESKIYLVMPYFALGDLSGTIYNNFMKNQPFSERMVIQFLTKASLALSYLLSNNIVHRDVKSSNFLVTKHTHDELDCVLSDFGFATSVSNIQMVIDDSSCTMKYASPELIETEMSTFKGDVFSLGCTLFEMMSFDFNTMLWKVIEQDEIKAKLFIKERIHKNFSEYSTACVDLVLSMLEKDPNNRPDYESIIKIAKEHYC
ncbi:predicted protein [Naegleria gruberi]|uniref:Predicted protein n=1 Tax=Naegleria gruberi TaxID=5762 RepID=D2VHQ8_NAEGR|nr:uncharacterized protein NAEGRDRAFT_68412 [Naegleria gruberi]EFC43715.1 predicted protein [Naegleria gruberi]|eukprot:XP_002676459.1 predicted protein [Naegleria gruberi strain NEG-M]